MSDETAVVGDGAVAGAETPATEQAQTPATTGEQTARAFSQAEVDAMIKARLERAEKSATERATKAQQDAEAKALADQGKFKELYERAQADALAAQQKATALELAQTKRAIADKVGLPAVWVDRLHGDTPDELEADAKSILAMIPKPAAPNINATPGAGATPVPGQMTPEQKAELAARYGVNPKYL